jgi:hypothetical protein
MDISNKYANELKYYDFINNQFDFLALPLRGSVKYINKYDGQLRKGGLLIKILNENDKLFCLIKHPTNKIYKVSYSNNLIYYCKNKNDKLRNWIDCFITDLNNNQYEIN